MTPRPAFISSWNTPAAVTVLDPQPTTATLGANARALQAQAVVFPNTISPFAPDNGHGGVARALSAPAAASRPSAITGVRVKRTYQEDNLICQRLVIKGFGILFCAALRKPAAEDYAAARAGEGIYRSIAPERRRVLFNPISLSPENLPTYRKDFLGKNLSKTSFKTNRDMRLELQEKVVAERQWGAETCALDDELSRFKN